MVIVPATNLDSALSLADFPSTGRVYSIIVGSTQTRRQAEVHIQNLPSLRYPVSIIPYESDAGSGFRVGVGIFQALDDSESALASIRDSLPDGGWSFRIQ